MAVRTEKLLAGIMVGLGTIWLTVGDCAAEDDSLRKGAWALQFEVNGDFDLGPFQGKMISIKKHTGDGAAYRFGLDFSLTDNATDKDDFDVDEYGSGESQNTKLSAVSTDLNARSFALTVQRISYPKPGRRIKLFYGIGPTFTHSHKDDDRYIEGINVHIGGFELPDTVHFTQEISSSMNGWSLGMRGILGVEWFASPSISLLAEYNSNLAYSWSRTEAESVSTSFETEVIARKSGVSDSDGIEFGAGAVKFGLSAYF